MRKQYNHQTYLPEGVTDQDLEAEYANGVLTISFSKSVIHPEIKSIPIK